MTWLHIDRYHASDRAVFARPYTLEAKGHLLDVWADDDRVNHGECQCPSGGRASFTAVTPQLILEGWRIHYEEQP